MLMESMEKLNSTVNDMSSRLTKLEQKVTDLEDNASNNASPVGISSGSVASTSRSTPDATSSTATLSKGMVQDNIYRLYKPQQVLSEYDSLKCRMSSAFGQKPRKGRDETVKEFSIVSEKSHTLVNFDSGPEVDKSVVTKVEDSAIQEDNIIEDSEQEQSSTEIVEESGVGNKRQSLFESVEDFAMVTKDGRNESNKNSGYGKCQAKIPIFRDCHHKFILKPTKIQ